MLMQTLADELLALQAGFTHNQQTWHLILIGVKGDMPFLSKTGHFDRHWLRAPKKSETSKRSKTGKERAPPGVCWLCLAGQTPHPFEDFNKNASWATAAPTPPWSRRPCFLQLWHAPSEPWSMFRPDIWHNYHGGVGKNFISSSLVEALELFQGSKENKVLEMAALLREWAGKPGNSMPHSGNFCSERVGLTSMQILPEAVWSKHDDTRVYHAFLQDLLESRVDSFQGDPVLTRILDALQSINRSFQVLYESGLWLTRSEANLVGSLGKRWLRLYSELAFMSHQAGKLRFSLVVKHHMMDHSYRRLLDQSKKSDWTLSPLCDSVQMDEATCLGASRYCCILMTMYCHKAVIPKVRTSWGIPLAFRGGWLRQQTHYEFSSATWYVRTKSGNSPPKSVATEGPGWCGRDRRREPKRQSCRGTTPKGYQELIPETRNDHFLGTRPYDQKK